jgi:hypothetical protein
MIAVNCPSCGKSLNIRPEHAGKRLRCPECKGLVTVPESIPEVAVSSTPSIESRLSSLEAENSRLRASLRERTRSFALALGGVAAVVVFLFWTEDGVVQALTHEIAGITKSRPIGGVIEAEGFVVRDAAGKVRATLGTIRADGAPARDPNAYNGLHLFDGGKEKGVFAMTGGGSAVLECLDAEGTSRMGLSGEGDEGVLYFNTSKGHRSVTLSSFESGSAMLVFSAVQPTRGLEIGVSDRPFLNVIAQGKESPLLGKDGLLHDRTP